MKLTVLGLGEAGRVYAEAFAQAGAEVLGFDPGPVETPEGVTRAPSAAEAVADADFVLSLTTARFAVSAARECLESLREGVIYLDLNASSPNVKQEVHKVLDGKAKVADGALIGSVRTFGAGAEILLSGPGSNEAAAYLGLLNARPDVLSDEVGEASRRKLLRSIFMKGLAALVHEVVEVGSAAGEDGWVREQMANALVGGHDTVNHLDRGIRIHARRRSHELADSLALIGDYPGTGLMASAARELHLLLARQNEHKPDVLDSLRNIPTAAIGDATDRLGYVGADIKPVWSCPQISGPALTVATRAGDNLAIHKALNKATPGDVLVVSAEGGRDRALIGDLIAERAKAAGVAGMILDGPVRDISGIIASGLPVWASGVSSAGPYKAGPVRLGEPIAIGNAVCHKNNIVVADQEGILFIPETNATSLVESAEEIIASEFNIKQARAQKPR